MNKNTNTKKLDFSRFGSLVMAVLLAVTGLLSTVAPKAFAATTMTQTSVVETNMDSAGTSAVWVAFKAGAADAATSLTVAFNTGSGFVWAGSPTVTTTGCTSFFSGATALPGTLAGSTGSGVTLTVNGVTSLTSGTLYCFAVTGSAVTNPTTSTSTGYTTTITDATDSQSQGVYIIGSSAGTDQIAVTAQVSSFFTLTFSSNADTFASPLSSTALSTSNGVNLTVSTNAVSGWGLWAEDATNGLNSTSQTHPIGMATVNSNSSFNGGKIGSEWYGLGVTTANATVAYADAGGTTGAGMSSTAWNEIAKSASAGSGVTVTAKELADISTSTPNASDYADTITIVGDGSF
jgi:hypothetical protein